MVNVLLLFNFFNSLNINEFCNELIDEEKYPVSINSGYVSNTSKNCLQNAWEYMNSSTYSLISLLCLLLIIFRKLSTDKHILTLLLDFIFDLIDFKLISFNPIKI